MHRTSRHPYHEEPPQLDGIASPPVPEGRRDRQREEGKTEEAEPPSPRSGRGTEKDEARRNEEQPRTRDRCRRPCMICDTDRESWREEARETERTGEGEKRGSKDNLHYFSRFFMPTPEPRPAEPATRAAVIVSASTHGKALASIPLLWSMRNWKQSTHIFSPCRPGDGLHFRSRRKPGSQLLYPLLHLPKNFSISLLPSVP